MIGSEKKRFPLPPSLSSSPISFSFSQCLLCHYKHQRSGRPFKLCCGRAQPPARDHRAQKQPWPSNPCFLVFSLFFSFCEFPLAFCVRFCSLSLSLSLSNFFLFCDFPHAFCVRFCSLSLYLSLLFSFCDFPLAFCVRFCSLSLFPRILTVQHKG